MTSRFIIHHGRRASLYCKVTHQDARRIEAVVINGAWEFTLHTDTGAMSYPSPSGTQFMTHCEVMWLPHDKGDRHYNEVLEWADKRLSKHPAHRWLLQSCDLVMAKIDRQLVKWRRARVAFVNAWNGTPSVLIDDDIPL